MPQKCIGCKYDPHNTPAHFLLCTHPNWTNNTMPENCYEKITPEEQAKRDAQWAEWKKKCAKVGNPTGEII